MATSKKAFDSEEYIRESYAIAEKMDLEGWKSRFTDGGIFVDNSVGITYEGSELDYPVRQYGAAFADMHRELYRIWIVDNTSLCGSPFRAPTPARLRCPSGRYDPPVRRWMPRVRTSSNWRAARSRNSIAIPRARSF